MKIQLEYTDRKWIYLTIFILIFATVSIFQYYRNKDLREAIKQDKELIKSLNKDVSTLYTQINSIEMEKAAVLKRVDSFEIQEQLYKDKYYASNQKLRKIISDYNSASSNDKWDLLTRALAE